MPKFLFSALIFCIKAKESSEVGLEYERRTLMGSRHKRLDTDIRGGLCDVSVQNLRCLSYSKNLQKRGGEDDKCLDATAGLAGYSRAVFREEEAQKEEKFGILAKFMVRDSMMEARGGNGGDTDGDAKEGEEHAYDEDMETNSEGDGLALATEGWACRCFGPST